MRSFESLWALPANLLDGHQLGAAPSRARVVTWHWPVHRAPAPVAEPALLLSGKPCGRHGGACGHV